MYDLRDIYMLPARPMSIEKHLALATDAKISDSASASSSTGDTLAIQCNDKYRVVL